MNIFTRRFSSFVRQNKNFASYFTTSSPTSTHTPTPTPTPITIQQKLFSLSTTLSSPKTLSIVQNATLHTLYRTFSKKKNDETTTTTTTNNNENDDGEGEGKNKSKEDKVSPLLQLIESGRFKSTDLKLALEEGSKIKRTYSEFMFLQEMTEALESLNNFKSNADKRRFTSEILSRRPLLSGDFLRNRIIKANTKYRVLVRDVLIDDIKTQKSLNLTGSQLNQLANELQLEVVSSTTAMNPTNTPKPQHLERMPDDGLSSIYLFDSKRFQYAAGRYGLSAFGINSKQVATADEKVIWFTPDATENDQWHKCYQATELLLGGASVSFQIRLAKAKRQAILEAQENELRQIAANKSQTKNQKGILKESSALEMNEDEPVKVTQRRTSHDDDDDDDGGSNDYDRTSKNGHDKEESSSSLSKRSGGKYYKKKVSAVSSKGTEVQLELYEKMLRISQVLLKIRDDRSVQIIRDKVASLNDRFYKPEDVTELSLIKGYAEDEEYEINEKMINDSKSKNNPLFHCSTEGIESKMEVIYQPKTKK